MLDIDNGIQVIQESVKYLEERLAYLQEENEKLKSEIYKDERIAELEKENWRLRQDMDRGFPISEEEYKKIKEFQMAHRHIDSGAIGGEWEFRFRPTGIGVIGKLTDGKNELIFQEL